MATLSHVAAGMVVGRLHANATARPFRASCFLFTGLAIAPDLDIFIGRSMTETWPVLAHRGAAHSLGVALVAGLLVWLSLRRWRSTWPAFETALAVGIALASNGLLDVFSAGPDGVALFWPLIDERVLAIWQPIPDAPIETIFTTTRGIRCLILELALCLPAAVWALWKKARRASSWILRIVPEA